MEPKSPQSVHHQAELIPSPQSSQVLRTPRPPFSPPRRRSSLAFSSARKTEARPPIIAQQNISISEAEGLRLTKPNISRKRALPSPGLRGDPSPAHIAQMQRLFQAAKTNMHLEMQVASSPASSIESRMNIVDTQGLRSDSRLQSSLEPDMEESVSLRDKLWRYSIAPHLLATTNLDVREPLPSPTLPDTSNVSSSHPDAQNVEPLSSGFASPADIDGDNFADDMVSLPPLPPSSPHVLSDTSREEFEAAESPDTKQIRSDTNLEQPLNQLKVTNNDESEDTTMEDSPIISYLKRRSGGSDLAGAAVGIQQSPEHHIYLSEHAEAAAESAKAKRKLLRERLHFKDDDTDTGDQEHAYRALTFNEAQNAVCPDPAIHHGVPLLACPHVVVNNQLQSLEYLGENKPPRLVPRMPVDHRTGPTARPLQPQRSQPKISRATATGSPMPFVRGGSRPTSPDSPIFLPSQPPMSSQLPVPNRHSSYRVQSPIPSSPEHIGSGWYQPSEPFQRSDAPVYSFSTAASKVVGSNQAPDSRIRDSYKTDTLTSITMPPNRYRKNGIGANMSLRGVGRYYSRPPSRNRPATSGTRPGSRNTIRTFEDVRFRSSPPRSLDNFRPEYARRPRAPEQARHLTIAEDTLNPQAKVNQSNALHAADAMNIDEGVEALAIRNALQRLSTDVMSMDTRAIRELSPNIAIYRKGVPGDLATRRTRRPSYWDDDLKEVRESPAGRGGVYSPVSAQQSMRAEVENVSIMNEEITVDEDDLVGEVERAGEEFEKRLGSMPGSMTSAPPASQELIRQEEAGMTADVYQYDGELSG